MEATNLRKEGFGLETSLLAAHTTSASLRTRRSRRSAASSTAAEVSPAARRKGWPRRWPPSIFCFVNSHFAPSQLFTVKLLNRRRSPFRLRKFDECEAPRPTGSAVHRQIYVDDFTGSSE